MANTILLKKSSTAAAQPTAGQLVPGELAINTADGRLFAKNAANTVVNLPVSSISGQAITPASVQTSGTADGIKIQAGGTANSRVITLQPTALGGNRTLTLPDATAELAMTFNPLAVTGASPFANQKRGTIRNNFDDPTTEEAALFHGQFYNQLRFLSPALQEESADGGTTWTTSTRMSVDALGNMMRGEGEGTSVSIIPAGSSTPLGYRLTWDDTVTGVVYWTFSHLYINCSTNGNLTTFKIEAFHNTNGWTEIFTGTASNWPGHVSIKHTVIPYYPTNAGEYGKLRVTFTASTTTYTTPVTLYSMEWFGGYPNGKRNAESYDRLKNVTFPAAISTPIGYRINNGGAAGQYLRGNGTQFISAGIQAGDVPTLNQSTTGSAGTLTTTRTLWGQNFNGGANVSGSITGAGNIEQTWSDLRVGMFYDNSYRMGFNYVTGSRLLNIFSTTADTGGAISFSTRAVAGASNADYGTEKMRITSAGDVGIGVVAPTTRLEVFGDTGLRVTRASNSDQALTLLGGNGSGLASITASYSLQISTAGGTSNPMTFLTASTERMRILGTGQVGIGTDNPQDRLHLNGSQTTMRLQSSTAYDTQFRFIDTASDWSFGINVTNTLGNGVFGIRSNTAAAHRLVIDATGRVGIANAVPYARLNVGAKVIDDASYTYDTNSLVVTHQTATSTSVLNDSKEVLLLARQGTGGQAYGAAASFQLSRYENSSVNSRTRLDLVLGHTSFMSSPTTVLTARSDGNVGIGTTSPTNSLHVVGTPNTSTGHGVIVVANSSTNATRVTHIGLPNDSHPFLAALNGTTTAGTHGWGFFDSSATGHLEIKRRSGSTTWVDALAIDRVNGNVGVGNAAPGSRLVVKGAGATSATSALNVTNSANASLLAVRDDGLTTVTGQISSTLAVGTAPFAVTSTTVCTNLNADTVDGQHASAFATSAHTHGSVTSDGKIGSTTGQVITTGSAGVLQASATLLAANLPAPQRLSSYCSGLFFG